jgi:hypothetical protein
MNRCVIVLVAALAAAGITACGKKESPTPGAKNATVTSSLPDSYWLAAAPPGAKPVGEIRKNAKTGDAVVVNGIVGGRKLPFTEGAAAFTIVDDGVKKCTAGECETPWDFCCEPPDSLKANMVFVEFRDGASPIRTGARGFHGLDSMKNVTVTGEAQRDEAGNVVVVAKGIYVAP